MTPLLQLENVSFTYLPKSDLRRAEKASPSAEAVHEWGRDPESPWALEGVTLAVGEGEFVGLAGHTGSGKSTLMQLCAGLSRPTRGRVLLYGEDLSSRHGRRKARETVGIAFQYPENQLFSETVFDDVAFGPRNLGLDPAEVEARVEGALRAVGLDPETVGRKSPFSLSGGQQRRAAIAGIFAMHPKVLVLDEPTAGLDPRSHDALLDLVQAVRSKRGLTVILASHNMDDLARLCDRVVVLDGGRVSTDGAPIDVFSDAAGLKSAGLEMPHVLKLASELGFDLGAFDGVPSASELAVLIARRVGDVA